MNDLLIPEWIKKRQSENELRDARDEASRQRQIADLFRIEKYAPPYYAELSQQLARNTDALPTIKFQGDTVPLPSFAPGEISYRIMVSIPGSFPHQTYTDVFYRGSHIECSMLNGGVRRYYFCVEDSKLGVLPEIPDGTVIPLGAKQFAEVIVRKMVDLLTKGI